MKKKIAFLLVALIACAGTVAAQNRKAVRINEVMVQNEQSIVDDYGMHHPWIELFNSNFGPVNISAMYLSNDSTGQNLYPIPLGDVNTLIEKRQHVVFFADGEPEKGTFHTNFTLTPGQDNWVGLFDADGKLIDCVIVPASLQPDNSWARTEDGVGSWDVRDGGKNYVTPSGANIIKDSNDKIEKFATMDSHGFGMAIMAMAIVFSALLILCLCFYAIGKIGGRVLKGNKMRAHGEDSTNIEARKATSVDSGEEIAAIVMALHDHINAHDNESTVLTINKVKRAYSPWSSKIYSLREVPRHEHHR